MVFVYMDPIYKWQFAHSPFWVTFSLFASCSSSSSSPPPAPFRTLWIYRHHCGWCVFLVFSFFSFSSFFHVCAQFSPWEEVAVHSTPPYAMCMQLFIYLYKRLNLFLSIDLYMYMRLELRPMCVFFFFFVDCIFSSFDVFFIVFDFMCIGISIVSCTRNETENNILFCTPLFLSYVLKRMAEEQQHQDYFIEA